MQTYMTIPKKVEAIQFNGTNFDEIQEFTNNQISKIEKNKDVTTNYIYFFNGSVVGYKGYVIKCKNEILTLSEKEFANTYFLLDSEEI